MHRGDHNIVTREGMKGFCHMLGVFGGESRYGLIKEENFCSTAKVKAEVEAAALTSTESFVIC